MHRLYCPVFVLVVTCITAGIYAPVDAVISAGDPFPALQLAAPAPEERAYLGLDDERAFTIEDVKADLLLVEILSVYCVHCQGQAPVYNRIHALLDSDSELSGKVKLMGIAVGSGEMAIGDFRGKYGVTFPLIPDPNFVVHNAIGGTRTPFLIIVRKNASHPRGIVVKTHAGSIKNTDYFIDELRSLLSEDLSEIHRKSAHGERSEVIVEPVLSDEELLVKIGRSFAPNGEKSSEIRKIPLKDSRVVYSTMVSAKGKMKRLFAEAVSRAVPCDVCHDVHFIYVFDESGMIVNFTPLQLTKYGNKPLDSKEVEKLRSRIVGRNVDDAFAFDPDVDAVTSATITSSVVFDSLSRAKALLAELEREKLW
jgi:hypothetical protein